MGSKTKRDGEGHPRRFVAAAVAGIAYMMFYFLRKAVSASSVFIRQSAGFPETAIGAITSSFAIAYGASRVPGGLVADTLGPRLTLSLDLALCALLTIATSCLAIPEGFYLLWFLHGVCQACAWPACARLLKDLFPDRERAFWWAAVSTSQNIGSALTPIIVAQVVAWFHASGTAFPLPIFPQAEEDPTWRFALLVLGLSCFPVAAFALAWLPSYRVKGGRAREHTNGTSTGNRKHQRQGRKGDNKQLTWRAAFAQLPRAILFITVANMLIYVVRDMIGNWVLLIFHETRGFDPARGATVLALFEVGGILGGLLAGIASDKVFAGRRGPIFGVCSAGLLLACIAVVFVESYRGICGAFFAMGFFLFGPQTLVGLFAMETAPAHLDSFAAGLVGLCAQIGGITAGYPVSLLKSICGWDCVLLALPVASSLCLAASIPLWATPSAAEKRAKKKKKKKE